MPAYVIVDVAGADGNDDRVRRYRAMSGASIARYGGRFIVRGGETHVLEGGWDPQRVVVAEFPSVEKAKEWYDSVEYREARTVRAGAGEWRMVLVEGIDG